MSTDLIPGRNPSLEIALLAILISGVAYGLVIALYISCVCVLRRKSRHPTRMRLISYSTILCLTSTWAFVQGSYSIMSDIFYNNAANNAGSSSRFSDWLLLTESNPWFLPVALWTADGIMVWRCVVLYQGISRPMRILLYFGLTMLCLMALVAGFCILIPLNIIGLGPIVSISVSGAINVTLSTLIVFRINQHKRDLQGLFGPEVGGIYDKIIVMCVESCALIVVCSVAYIALFFVPQPNGNEIPLFLLPHICAISPMLIVYRGAHQRESEYAREPSTQLSVSMAFTSRKYSEGGSLVLELPKSTYSSAASSPVSLFSKDNHIV